MRRIRTIFLFLLTLFLVFLSALVSLGTNIISGQIAHWFSGHRWLLPLFLMIFLIALVLLKFVEMRTLNRESAAVPQSPMESAKSSDGDERGGSQDGNDSHFCVTASFPRVDWGTAVTPSPFYGRTKELSVVEHWITEDRCQAIAVIGMGGIGKTAFTIQLVKRIHTHFDYFLWRSLVNSPSAECFLEECVYFLAEPQKIVLPRVFDDQLSMLVDQLRNQRCLLVLDNFESVLRESELAGTYRSGYENYGKMIIRLSEVSHKSCVLLTSREKPKDILLLEGKSSSIRSFKLGGLARIAGNEILQEKRLRGTRILRKKLIDRYNGNPLMLKLVAVTVHELFDDNIATFLSQNVVFVGDIRSKLEEHFDRLSRLEQEVLYWLSIEREKVSLMILEDNFVGDVSKERILNALMSLRQRSLLEVEGTAEYSLQPVVMEFTTSILINKICEEIKTESIDLFMSHALIKARAKDYIRDAQVRLIMEPVIGRLLSNLGRPEVVRKITAILRDSRERFPGARNYAGGNAVNLLFSLNQGLCEQDFSHLTIWQANLQGAILQRSNFSNSDLSRSLFLETFGAVLSLAISPDGRNLAAGGVSGDLDIWQIPDGRKISSLKGHTDWIRSVAFHPNANIVASGSEDKTVRLWDLTIRQCIVVLKGHSSWVYSVCFSPDGSRLVTSGEDKTARVWDVETQRCLTILKGHAARVTSVIFCTDERFLLTSSDDRTLRLWNIETGECIRKIKQEGEPLCAVDAGLDGIVASGGEDYIVRTFDVKTGRCLRNLRGHTARVRCAAFDRDLRLLASGSDDHTIRLWNVDTGICLRILYGHTSWISSVAFNSNDRILASSSDDRTIRLWNYSSGQCIRSIWGHNQWLRTIAFDPSGRFLASGSDDCCVRLWNAETGQCLRVLTGHESRIRSAVFSPDGERVFSSSDDQTVRIWNFKNGKEIMILHEHTKWVRSIAIAANGSVLASSCDDHNVRLWNVSTGECIGVLAGHSNWVWSVAICSDRNIVASGSDDKTVRLWDARTGKCIIVLEGHRGGIWSVAFSPDGNIVASGGEDSIAILWDLETGKILRKFEGHSDRIRSLALSPDGRSLATASEDKSVLLWDTATGDLVGTLRGHTNRVMAVSFAPDGSAVASCSADETIRIWDVESLGTLRTMRSSRPYEGMVITGVRGLTESQTESLKVLGAIDSREREL